MDPKATGKYHHGDLRRALLEAAIASIGEHGPKRFSLRAVTQSLNVSHAAAYRHFRGRDDLLRAVSIEGMNRLGGALMDAARQCDGPSETIKRCAIEYVRFGLANPGLYQVMFSAPTQQDKESKTAADAVMDVTTEIMAGGQRDGLVRPGEPREHARAAWALCHGLVDLQLRQQMSGHEPGTVLDHAERLLDTLFEGLFIR